MASDYAVIRANNERKYGTDIARIGPMLLAKRYDDRTHFIFELLQNAEDALRRRNGWAGRRAISFELSRTALRIAHFGKLFDEADVRGICGIAESTHDLTDIGRFGIGFKSVYAVTHRPEVHSGEEDFAIESFVWPKAAAAVARHVDETVMILPLGGSDHSAHGEIAKALQKLGPRTLLFLHEIEEVNWTVEGASSGLYLRDRPEALDAEVRRVALVGEQQGSPDFEEEWLVFRREARTNSGAAAGSVEIAFLTRTENGDTAIEPLTESPLVVFFPTVVQTNLGFLVQGPYRTTPSRDNVPRQDPWNQQLIAETATLAIGALRWLRDNGLLDTACLECLPLDRAKFAEETMFAPVFDAVRAALLAEPLLPASDGTYVSAREARLARTQDLRDLLDPSHLGALFDYSPGLHWLVGDISQDRTPELRRYLMSELDVPELTPESILGRLSKAFLEAQRDGWILRLYAFLRDQPALRRRLEDVPLIRLENGAHVQAFLHGRPQAFLPSKIETSFPTVRTAACATDEARAFLRGLGLTEPDPVDDVIWNVLRKYRVADVEVSAAEYEADLRRLITASATDSQAQREKLLTELRAIRFVKAIDLRDGPARFVTPGDAYLATERLRELFDGIPGVLLVDDSQPGLRGEQIRDLLEACGATRHLRAVPVKSDLGWEERHDLRIAAGHEYVSHSESVSDFTLYGLDALLGSVPNRDAATQRKRAGLLWDALRDLEERRGSTAFEGIYSWFYYSPHRTTFPAAFIRRLNEVAWIPDQTGELQPPGIVAFESLDWTSDPFLLSKIRFKPSLIDALAKEVGIEPGVLDLLKQLGLTSETELRIRLGIDGPAARGSAHDGSSATSDDVDRSADEPDEGSPAETQRSDGPDRGESADRRREGAESPAPTDGHARRSSPDSERDGPPMGRTDSGEGRGEFISYVAVQRTEEDDPDPDGLDREARMALEEIAIAHILARDPVLRRAPDGNPGYDLFEEDDTGAIVRWVEVKAMARDLSSRPVGLSRAQFDYASATGHAYWIYVVENASNPSWNLIRIQNPAGRARSFTFDRGWLNVAV